MKESCLDIGIIQAFLDGELAHDQIAMVSGHVATCGTCALMIAEAEDESAIVFPALEREFDTLVPTQRLWNKINHSIAAERESRPFLQKVWAFLTVSLANPSIAAAMILLIIVGVFTATWFNRTAIPADETVAETSPKASSLTATTPVAQPPMKSPGDVNIIFPARRVASAERTAHHIGDRRGKGSRFDNKGPTGLTSANGFVPGEESYTRTISSLIKTVDDQKAAGVMRPGERVAYERDMAVVNDTIARMKKEVRRNPKNESARQVLYSSFQNKIDLLNSVAQKEELVASLN
jgi:hypothetical protein